MKIHILSDEMASRIAAGEVVERPASVVKELMENSLDAGATEIFVWLEKSGTAVIRITDNGEGMTPEDLALAVERHATSKLREADDLFRIATLGFRGEALPSIGSIAKMAISSRPASSVSGAQLTVDGGKRGEVHAAAAAVGTTIEIREIFFNTPARRKFLKAPATELSHVCDVVNRLALAHPQFHFRLQHDGRTVADYISVKLFNDRLQQVLGVDVAKHLKPFTFTQGETTVRGFLSTAPTSFPNPRYLFTFVNRRYVRDKVITHAVLHGYDTLLMKGQYPAVVLFLEVPFAEVDVNVHPAKYEVRFRRQSDVHESVSRSVRSALQRDAQAPGGVVAMSSDASWPRDRQPAYSYALATGLTVRESLSGYATHGYPNVESTPSREATFTVPQNERPGRVGFFSSLTIHDQILGCYLVCSATDRMILIDQHAAHERIAFERLRHQLQANAVERQDLLIPQSVELSAGEIMMLEQKLDVLEGHGFSLEPFGPSSFAIKSVPALLPEGDYSQLVRQMVAELAEVDTSARLRQHLEDRLATMACHSVIRANRKLEMEEMRALLRDLDQVEFATQCPHGRPVLVELSRDQLERMFKRVV
ncbi:MAG: DNA mismatch repair endonuclease MutL [Candidatus Binatia bacterium]